MRIVVLINPNSGRGRGERAGLTAVSALRAAGHAVTPLSIADWDDFADEAEDADLVVIAGGDGTVHHALELLIRERVVGASPGGDGTGAPASPAVFHLPCGTENLFAREFRMTRDADALVRAAAAWNVRVIDLARVRGRPFAIMVSIGPDASVIHRVNAGRDGAITHLSYVQPILAETLRPALPRLRVEVERDGRLETLAVDQRGWLVVANLRQYALRIDPCARAAPDDGLLDAAFFPASISPRVLRWIIRCRLRLSDTRLARAAGARHALAQRIRVTSLDAAPVQVDGEVGGMLEPNRTIELVVRPRTLHVLVP